MIGALAGRRIDAADAKTERFPARLRYEVGERIELALTTRGITTLVCAAACGADLIAIDAARRRGADVRIVLPHTTAEFRRVSVVDRGAEWGEPFDRFVAEAASRGALHVLGLPVDDPHAFETTNAAILDDALALAGGAPEGLVAIVVWDGPFTERKDYTGDFAAAARARGIPVLSIPILSV